MGCPFGTAIDTWSVGVILLELVIGRPLFRTSGSRAALLRQSFCALGPLPLRRFRVGRYFSKYFNQDQSLKVMSHSAYKRWVGWGGQSLSSSPCSYLVFQN